MTCYLIDFASEQDRVDGGLVSALFILHLPPPRVRPPQPKPSLIPSKRIWFDEDGLWTSQHNIMFCKTLRWVLFKLIKCFHNIHNHDTVQWCLIISEIRAVCDASSKLVEFNFNIHYFQTLVFFLYFFPRMLYSLHTSWWHLFCFLFLKVTLLLIFYCLHSVTYNYLVSRNNPPLWYPLDKGEFWTGEGGCY